MACYCVYFMDQSRHVFRFQEFTAEDDHRAVIGAALLRSESAMGLWTESRRVRRWEARAAAASDELGSLCSVSRSASQAR
jgi:hypothetical protein